MSSTLFYPVPGANASFQGTTLVMPAVSMGNVGQMALDLILNQAQVTDSIRVEKVGYLHSEHVVPIAGNSALDGNQPQDLCTSVEVFQFPDHNTTVVQQRGQVLPGHVQLLVTDIVDWIQEAGFSQVVMLGGSDASFRTDAQIKDRSPRYVTTSSVKIDFVEKLSGSIGKELEQYSIDPRTGLAVEPLGHLVNSGLLRKMFAECEKRAVGFVGLLLFCKEGVNVPEALIMATCFNQYNQILDTELTPSTKDFSIPKSWGLLFGSVPDTNLYM